ncbi:hypothetical protein [Sellimonas intestinalis]|uniref:hypothetical protein n=1 Tax=Sellimonas intestinalis TaxID=1653434 RepID=UPI000E426753|nr:hypothetical protein [Sellimonas intestinalis]RGD36241.1 hypothetical protein DW166_14795 [Sellimonas intestinalis]
MQELEKILEEIEHLEKIQFSSYTKPLITIEDVEKIIRKHMNDGWIPVEERLPTREEFLKDDGRFILDDGNRRYQGLFDIYDGKFKFSRHISGIHYELFEDKCVIAWHPLPDPYRPERKDGCSSCNHLYGIINLVWYLLM